MCRERRRFGWPWRLAVVRGPSMSPTLCDGDVLLVSLRARLRPGAVVLVQWAQRPGQISVKRAVGRHADGWWVLGDNPAASTDSRHLATATPLAVVLAVLSPRFRIQRAQRGNGHPNNPAQPAECGAVARSWE
ncbi:MAG: S26 family signal peptidase [Pseudonocardiaceae bacterium]